MKLPKGYYFYELRGKRGRKNVVIFRTVQQNEYSWYWYPIEKIIGPVAWYKGRSKTQMKRVTNWFPYW